MYTITNLFTRQKSQILWLGIFIFGYALLRSILIYIPFFNLMLGEFDSALIVVWIMIIIFRKFNYETLIIASIMLLAALGLSLLIKNGINDEAIGVMVYISLFVGVVKYYKK